MLPRLLCCAFLFLSSSAFCQSGTEAGVACTNGIIDRDRVWSPDCRSYFESSHVFLGRMTPFPLSIFTVRGKAVQVGSPTEEITCNLAIERLACSSVEFHHLEWVGSDRLRLQVHMVCGPVREARDFTYLVDAQTGAIIASAGPATRNWSCPKWSEQSYGGPASSGR